jgi:hypothetical protein
MRKLFLLLVAICTVFMAGMFANVQEAKAIHFGPSYTECYDGHDNDLDGGYDWQDPGYYWAYPPDLQCDSKTDTSEAGAPSPPPPPPGPVSNGKVCGNLIDDDNDGKIDYPNDPGCYSKEDTDEGNVAQCGDGVDNDADNKIDMGNVQVWPSGAYAPRDDGCDNAWDTSEFMEQAPPSGGEVSGEETGSGETYVKDTGDSEPSSLISFSPLPPTAPNVIWCSRQTDLRFNNGFTFYGGDIMTYKKPTKFFFRITFRCNKPIIANNTDWTLQTRPAGSGVWTIKDLGVDSSGGFGNVVVNGPSWNGTIARQYAYTFLHTWACKNVVAPPSVLETDYRITRKETGSAQLYTLSNPPQPVIFNWSPVKSFGVMRISGFVTEQCYP